MANDLTAKDIAELAPRKTPHRVAPNLYLIRRSIEAPGAWVFIYASPLTGKRTEMGLGPARDVSIKQAKAEALEHRLALLKGRCPLSERRAAETARKVAQASAPRAAHTFATVAKLCISSKQAGWKSPKQAAQWENSLEAYAYPVMGQLPVDKIAVGEVMDALEPIWRTKPETASRVRSRIENVLDYAKARGWRSGENPARWRGHLDALLPARGKVRRVRHHTAIPWRNLPALYQRLVTQRDVSALALLYTILNALRTGEVIGTPAKGEIDTAAEVHTVPGVRMKAGKQHRVPLSDEAIRVLTAAEQIRTGDWLFNGAVTGRPLSNMAMLEKLQGIVPDATVHGMRSCFRDWARENGVAREVAEACLAHVIESKSEAAYARGDLLEPRRGVMQRWADFLTGRAAGNNVESLDEVRVNKNASTA